MGIKITSIIILGLQLACAEGKLSVGVGNSGSVFAQSVSAYPGDILFLPAEFQLDGSRIYLDDKPIQPLKISHYGATVQLPVEQKGGLYNLSIAGSKGDVQNINLRVDESPIEKTTIDSPPGFTIYQNSTELMLAGSNLTRDISVEINQNIVSFQLIDNNQIAIRLPEELPLGNVIKLEVFHKNRVLLSSNLLVIGRDLPFSTQDPIDVCSSVEYINKNGEITEGAMDCSSFSQPPQCSESQSSGCIANNAFPAVDAMSLDPAKIATGHSIGSVIGTLVEEFHVDCTMPNQFGCVATNALRTFDAGSAGAITPLTNLNFANTIRTAGDFQFWDNLGVRHVVSADTDLAAANIVMGTNIYGVNGSAIEESHSDCVSAGSVGCITTNTFRSMDVSAAGSGGAVNLTSILFDARVKANATFEYWDVNGNRHTSVGSNQIVPANIRDGVTLFGIDGNIDPPCSHSSEGACNADSACLWNTGSCEIDSWNIRSGVNIYGSIGSLKLDCRDGVNSTYYNTDTNPIPSTSDTSGTVVDWWDAVDFHTISPHVIPSELPAGWTSANICSYEGWRDDTMDGSCNVAADDCIMTDRKTLLQWTERNPLSGGSPGANASWSGAIDHCSSLSYGGFDDWRLPTAKELTTAYVNGIYQLFYYTGTTRPGGNTLINNDAFQPNHFHSWSATTNADIPANARRVAFDDGSHSSTPKTTSLSFICVRSSH